MTLSNVGPVEGQGRFVSVETYDSRIAELQDGRERRTRTFKVYAPTNNLTAIPDARQAVLESGVKFGDPHPENGSLYAVDVRVRIDRRTGRGMFIVEWTYRAVSPGIGSEGPRDPEAPGYTEFNVSTDPTLVDVYRAPPFFEFPTNGTPNGPWPSDIGGVPIDSAGQRGSYLHRRGILEVLVNVPFDQFNVFTSLEAGGARNQSAWQGFTPGILLYLGARSSRISADVVEVVHQLGYDEFFHLQQVADTDEDGNVRLSTPGVTNIGGQTYESAHAYPVRWFQPFPREVDFNLVVGSTF